MGEVVRGQDIQIQLFGTDGDLLDMHNPNSGTFNMDDNKDRQKRLGTRRKPVRQTIDGHSGSMVYEEEGPALDDMEDALIAGYLNGEPIAKIDIIRRKYYPSTGQTATWVYPGACFSLDRDTQDQDSPTQTALNWTSEPRYRLNN